MKYSAVNSRFICGVFFSVNADDTLSAASRPSNGTVEPPDTRSAIGRVPPYQPPANGVPGMQLPGFRPHSPYTRVDAWHR